jgi:hypothetical protein
MVKFDGGTIFTRGEKVNSKIKDFHDLVKPLRKAATRHGPGALFTSTKFLLVVLITVLASQTIPSWNQKQDYPHVDWNPDKVH